jgi:hypothetical protein
LPFSFCFFPSSFLSLSGLEVIIILGPLHPNDTHTTLWDSLSFSIFSFKSLKGP